MIKYKHFFSLLLLCFTPFLSMGQMTIDNTSQTVEQFLQNVLLGGGVTISNVQFNGGPASVSNEQVGSFDDPTGNVGFTNGLILGSGDVQLAAGANVSGSNSMGGSGAMGVDTDLQSITPNQIWDECVIEFDFVPSGDTISFQYTFASEEYEEYVCGTVNDAFGFFLTGPDPNGGNYTAFNIARVPDPANPGQFTSTPVSINTINQGTPGAFGSAANCNSIDPNWATYNIFYQLNTVNTYEYDGRTVILNAVAPVICGETYHIKLAIGDGGDGAFDSGVFLEGNSFSSTGLSISANVSSIHEGCPGAYYVITRPDTSSYGTVQLVIQGDAVNGSDYAAIPNFITFDPGALTDTIWVDVFDLDGDTTAVDTLEIFIDDSSACGGPKILILQTDPLLVSITSGDTICTQAPFFDSLAFVSTATGGVPGGYAYYWSSYPPYSFAPPYTTGDSDVVVSPPVKTEFFVTVFDACGNRAESQSELVVLECLIDIPNVFTPNGDGVNDFLQIVNIDHYPNNSIAVFNRWGNLVFEKDNYQNDWDGGDLAEGVYFFVFYPNGRTREQNPYNGTFYILGKKD